MLPNGGIAGCIAKEQITIMYVPAATSGSFSIMNELTGNYWRNYKGAAFKIFRASPCSLEINGQTLNDWVGWIMQRVFIYDNDM